MFKRQVCAKFQSQIFYESEVIQILKVVRWHFCQVYNKSIKACHYFTSYFTVTGKDKYRLRLPSDPLMRIYVRMYTNVLNCLYIQHVYVCREISNK